MRTLSRLMIAAGFLGTIAATGTTGAMAQGVYLQGPGFGVDIGRPAYRERHYYRGYSDYDSPRIYAGRRYNRGPDVYASLVPPWLPRLGLAPTAFGASARTAARFVLFSRHT
jgi:hypothetical protein